MRERKNAVAIAMNNRNASRLDTIQKTTSIASVADTFTLDLNNSAYNNFIIESTDANAKTIVFSNISSASDTQIVVNVLLKSTTTSAITYPSGVAFASGAPTFSDGEWWQLSFVSIDNGTTWQSYAVLAKA